MKEANKVSFLCFFCITIELHALLQQIYCCLRFFYDCSFVVVVVVILLFAVIVIKLFVVLLLFFMLVCENTHREQERERDQYILTLTHRTVNKRNSHQNSQSINFSLSLCTEC